MKVITAVVNNPIFIEIQYYTLKKYLKNDFEYIIFNDAKNFEDYTNYGDITIKNKIIEKCKELNIKCINIENDNHKYLNNVNEVSIRASETMNIMLKYQLENPDIYLILDSDMFLIDYLDIEKYKKYNSAVVLQSRENNNNLLYYIWQGLLYIDMNKIKNKELLDWSMIYGITDSGGNTYKWLNNELEENEKLPLVEDIRYKNINYRLKNIYLIKHLWSLSWNKDELPDNLKLNDKLLNFLNNDPRNKNNKYFCEIYDDVFLHYRCGGNWQLEGKELHNNLSLLLKETLC
jgi:hypothetical protein